eukprot:CFRG2459T1
MPNETPVKEVPAGEEQESAKTASTAPGEESWMDSISSAIEETKTLVSDQFSTEGSFNSESITSVVNEMSCVPGELYAAMSSGINSLLGGNDASSVPPPPPATAQCTSE